MELLRIIKNAQEDLLIVAEHEQKNAVLHAMHDTGLFHPVEFANTQDLFKKVFFTLAPHAIYDASEYFELQPAIIESMIPYLHRIDLDETYDTMRLRKLQTLKRYLYDHDLLTPNPFKAGTFKNKRILVLTPIKDVMLQSVLSVLEKSFPVEYHQEPAPKENAHTFCRYETLEDEIRDIAIRVRNLHAEGIPFESIKIVNAPSEASGRIETIFARYGIPLHINMRIPLENIPLVQSFYETLEASEAPFLEALKNTLESFGETLYSEHAFRIYQKLLSVLNPLIMSHVNKVTGLKAVKHLLSTNTLKRPQLSGAVDVIPIHQLPAEASSTLFVMGLFEGNAPVYAAENDYLNAEEKHTIGFPDAKKENTLRREHFIKGLIPFEHIHFSYAERGDEGPTIRASILDDFNRIFDLKTVEPLNFSSQVYSRTDDFLRIKADYDEAVRYGQSDQLFETYGNMFAASYDDYDNAFGPLKHDTLNRLNDNIKSVSVTQIERYFQCGLKFLLEDVLKIRPMDTPFHMDMGNLFHRVLEQDISLDAISDTLLTQRLDEVTDYRGGVHGRERVFFENVFDDIKTAHAMIKSQESSSDFEITAREKTLEVLYSSDLPVFKGTIDKIMTHGNYVALVDYKTGNKTLDLRQSLHGIRGQLLFYLLLYRANHKHADIAGFYEQTLLPKLIYRKKNKTFAMSQSQFYQLQGYTVNNLEVANRFDVHVSEASYIRGLKVKNDGSFSGRSKTFEPEQLDALLDTLETALKDALENIRNGYYPINPKRLNGDDISCAHCVFSDVCYHTLNDYERLNGPRKENDVFKHFEGGSE